MDLFINILRHKIYKYLVGLTIELIKFEPKFSKEKIPYLELVIFIIRSKKN